MPAPKRYIFNGLREIFDEFWGLPEERVMRAEAQARSGRWWKTPCLFVAMDEMPPDHWLAALYAPDLTEVQIAPGVDSPVVDALSLTAEGFNSLLFSALDYDNLMRAIPELQFVDNAREQKVTPFRIYNLASLPESLRLFAHKIEAGEIRADHLVIVVEHDGGHFDGYAAFGPEPFPAPLAAGVCFAAANRILNPESDDSDDGG